MICEECGCDTVEPRVIEGLEVGECELCGHIHGAAEDVSRLAELREGRDAGYEPLIYPLVKTIAMITGYKVVAASAGVADQCAPPFVHFKIHGPKCRALLEKLLTSLAMANRRLELPWVIEASLVRGLTFTLRPKIGRSPHELEPGLIRMARAGVDPISNQIRRDMSLSWWHELVDDE